MLTDLDRVVVPDDCAAPSWPNSDSFAIYEQLISGVRRAVNQSMSWHGLEVERTFEADYLTCCIVL